MPNRGVWVRAISRSPHRNKESVRDVYLADNPADAAVLLDKAIIGCLADEVPEIITLGAAPGSPARAP